MRLLIRADADARTGTGHVMRCLALAQAWREGGGAVTFRTACELPALLGRLTEAGAEVEPIEGQPGSVGDADGTREAARRLGASWVVLDGYHFGDDFQARVREGVRLLAIDDFGHAGRYAADLVLNQNLHARPELYRSREAHTELLLGPRYALLRREFWAARDLSPQRQRGPASNVLVTLGGSDPDNVTLRVVRALCRVAIPDLTATVVIGAASPHRGAVEEAASRLANVEVLCDVADMAGLMARTDVAVAAGGTTTWERARMGLPSLVVVLADNQQALAEASQTAGLGWDLGSGRDLDEAKLAAALERLLRDPEAWAAMAKRGPELVDGQGARRVCRILERAAVTLRPATRDDIRQLWEWANEPGTRAASFSPEPIPWERHQRWFPIKLTDPHCIIFIAAVEWESNPLGQVRFEREGDDAVISISLDASFRGRGYGPALIRLASAEAFRRWPVGRIVALIRADNPASRQAFRKAGFADDGTAEVRVLPAHRLTLRREAACLAS
jgi:UDP-2,4-diacetamido-2,4,6-trideoxy-beta-L-altropyranose hydrolase